MTDVFEKRVEAACEAYKNPRRMVTNTSDGRHRDCMEAALEAADAVVTVEMIVDELAGHPIGSGYYQTAVSVDEAREMAEAVQALIKKED